MKVSDILSKLFQEHVYEDDDADKDFMVCLHPIIYKGDGPITPIAVLFTKDKEEE